jgi:hypothetical protein
VRLNFASSWLSFDLWLFEQPDTDDTDPATPVVAGGLADTWPAPPAPDALQKADEYPEERHRRRTGFTA